MSVTDRQQIPVAEIIAVEPTPSFPGSYTVLVQCPHCGDAHTHGTSRSDGRDGHRESHCADGPDGQKPDAAHVGYYLGEPTRLPLRAYFGTLTPERAQEILDNMVRNRKPNPATVAEYADAIRAGEWVLTGEPIKIDYHGHGIDGRHRCLAVIRTGQPINVLFVEGLDPDSQDAMDSGRRRSVASNLELAGEKNYTTLAATATNVYKLRETANGTVKLTAKALTTPRAKALLAAEPGIRDSIPIGQRVERAVKLPRSWSSALHYLYSLVDAADADEFFELLITGEGLTAKDPILLLRQALIKDMTAPRSKRMPPKYKVALCIKAWNFWRQGKEVAVLKWVPGGVNKEPFPRWDASVIGSE